MDSVTLEDVTQIPGDRRSSINHETGSGYQEEINHLERNQGRIILYPWVWIKYASNPNKYSSHLESFLVHLGAAPF